MGFIQNILNWHRKKVQERNNACFALIASIDDALRDAASMFSSPQVFIDPNYENTWKNRNITILADSETYKIQRLKKSISI